MLRGWLHGKKGQNASTQSLDALAEAQNLEHAMKATACIFNDDVEGAEKGLSEGSSSFHKLGLGLTTFMRATLGFEQDIMRSASEQLLDAENTAFQEQARATYNSNAPNSYHSEIYPPGTEFAIAAAEAQLMSAVVGVLNESLTESIKGFYKLRKAYYTLDGILEMEKKYALENRGKLRTQRSKESIASTASQRSVTTASALKNEVTPASIQSPSSIQKSTIPESGTDSPADTTDSDEFFDATEEMKPSPIPTPSQGSTTEDSLSKTLSELTVTPGQDPPQLTRNSIEPKEDLLTLDPDSDVFSHSVDTFIHTGANLCFGLLSILIAMIPPAFGKLLYIIGFKGDRERGLKMLWQASKFGNMHGATAGLVILGYYNGLVGFCDIISDSTGEPDDIEGYPAARLQKLLADMRVRYPKSSLWLIEEARMQSANRNLDMAVELLSEDKKSPLKQVEALHMFEKGLNSMHSRRWEVCAESFLKCVELNSWSRALYYYIAGAAYHALYRELSQTDPTRATKYAKKADELFHLAPTQAGKKRFMAKQLPFDILVARKINKWNARAKEWGLPFVDAIGVSPIDEMIYFWNGYKRMPTEKLEESLQALAWYESPANGKLWAKEAADEKALLALLRAVVFRNLRRHDEAIELLTSEILSHDKNNFKGHLRDDWIAPTAHYEMAANYWMMRDEFGRLYELRWGQDGRGAVLNLQTPAPPHTSGASAASPQATSSRPPTATLSSLEQDRAKVTKCAEYCEKAAKWESYEMDARIGMKVTAAQSAIANWNARHPKA